MVCSKKSVLLDRLSMFFTGKFPVESTRELLESFLIALVESVLMEMSKEFILNIFFSRCLAEKIAIVCSPEMLGQIECVFGKS